MSEIFEITDFDNGVYPLGDPALTPDGCLVRGDGINPTKTGSVRSAHGFTQGFTPSSLGFGFIIQRIGAIALNVGWDGTTAFVQRILLFPTNTINTIAGITTGNIKQQSFALAPPHAGSYAYAFIPFQTPIKIDSNGVVSNWGIAAPPDNGVTAVFSNPVSNTIDPMSATAGWTTVGGTLTLDTVHFVSSPGSLKLTVASKSTASITKGVSPGLPGGSNYLYNDLVQLFVSLDQPQDCRDIVIDFDLNTNFTTDYFTFSMPVSALVSANNITLSTADASQVDTIMQNILYNPKFTVNLTTANQLMKDYYQGLKDYYKTFPNKKLAGTNQINTSQKGIQALLFAIAATLAPGNQQFWQLSIPQAAFTRIGKSAGNWQNISAVSIRVINVHSSDTIHFNFDQLQLSGGVGMYGDYQYLWTFTNANTGHYSMPNPTPLLVKGNKRNAITLSNLPASTDPQVTHLTIWRTVGNGGIFYRCADIPNGQTTFADIVSDMPGFRTANDPTVPSLSMETLIQNSILPQAIGGGALCKYFQGTMFTASGGAVVGRIFYSMAGDAEGLAGYTDVGNGDDPIIGFAIFNNTLYVFSQEGVWQAIDQSTSPIQPLWAFQQILGIPGADSTKSIIETDNSIIYREYGAGLRAFNGFEAPEICPQLKPLFMNESSGTYPPFGTIIASAYGNGEVVMSDGANGQTFSFNNKQQVRFWGYGLDAIEFYKGQWWGNPNNLGGFAQLQHPTEFANPTNFIAEPKHWYAGEKWKYKINRVFVDCNPNGNALSIYAVCDGTFILLGTTDTGAIRAVYEFGCNQNARDFGIRVSTNTYNNLIEIFRMAADMALIKEPP